MKLRLFFAAFFLGVFAAAAEPPATSAPATAGASSPEADLTALVGRIQAKLQQGHRTAADFTDELATFDALLTKYRGQKTDDVAKIRFMQAALYAEVFGDNAKARELYSQLKTDFASTEAAAQVDDMIANLDREEKAAKAQAALIGHAAPELHFIWSSQPGLKTLSSLKGKVVVLDFWATWCGPCVASFPDVRELTEHYRDTDVVVVGVSSIQGVVRGLEPESIDTKGDPAKELAIMADYIKAKNMTWTVAFSDQEVFNPDYGISGIPYMAIVAPDGTVRHAGLHPSMPAEEKYQKIDAILKEFGKKPPYASEPNK